ncbi:CHRD domain-containing protein [Alteromonas confluentis]|uniref:CHRD domain-containing protein n=2 Tax=Alteromonas confluentis TaxID=1656094 RepID=A0A1E7ZD65_9ALTE|nr:CHRD domain-containing protein [Alteromonas confluentis]
MGSAVMLSACGSDNDDDPIETPVEPTFTATTTYNIDLNGMQSVPMTGSMQMATATVEVDENLMQIRASVDISGVDGVTAVHIHDGDIGMNGDVAFGFEMDGDDAYTLAETDVTSELIEDLADGDWYINVHTETFENGEVRGQIISDDMAIVTFKMSGKQEVPAVSTMADGYVYALVSTTTYDLDLVVYTEDLDDASAAHIHTGRIGTNGDVLVALEQSMDDMTMWMTPEGTMIDEDILAVLVSGGHYVNVHSPDFPSGEIRGQILTDNYALATFALSGAQEVPAVMTDAFGSGYALVNTDDYGLELKVVTEGVDDATMAHIHTGRVGMNGDVLVALEQSGSDAGTWMTPENAMIDEETFNVLASGGHYVNVHTNDNAGGELRGQILTDDYVIATFMLDGEQEVPVVDTMAMGHGYALVNTSTYALELVVDTEGVDDATGAHIHTGNIGMNGDVLVALEQSADDMGMWMTPAETMIDADILAVLASGGHYVNVHTPANMGGEIRGQILTPEYTLVTFPLTGDQQVPAVTTTATGNGYALVNSMTYDLSLVAHTEGVDDATMAHIHTGAAGENGDVLVGLEQSMDDMGMWMTPANTMIDMDIYNVLISGGHYVNVHTSANPDGELRGQIE